ncbi:MAG TPA: ATP-binding protein, partial [Puia sp.]|nr:ATP-binding protein [Puia sp.]
ALPFWKTWWFITAVCILVVLSVYSLFRYRVNQIQKLYQLRSNISKDLHDQIGATLTSISFLSEVAKNRDNSTELTTHTLDRIGQYSRDMIAEMNDIVWIINPHNDSFEKIVDRVQDFAISLTASRNIEFSLEVDPGIKDVSLSMKQRKNLYLILKEAINNAAKHSNCSKLLVTLHNTNAKIYANIKDDGKGILFMQPNNSRNGLRNMKYRAEESGGMLKIQSEPGQGTTVSLVMSITQNAY